MGIYYNPVPPHIGAQAPLSQKKLTPPQSGPASDNPPFLGARISQAVLNCWAVAAVAIVLPQLLVPQQAQAAIVPAPRLPDAIYRAWEPPAPAAIVARNLNPPIAGPVASNPPFAGARVPLEVLLAWLPAQPALIVRLPVAPQSAPSSVLPPNGGAAVPSAVLAAWAAPATPPAIVARNLVPPISGPAPQNPPFMGGARIPSEVLLAWQLPLPAPITGGKIPPLPPAASNPPFAGARVPLEVQLAWLPSPPAPIARPARLTISAPLATNPPFMGGARIPASVLFAWLPPLPAPIVAVNLNPRVIDPGLFVPSQRRVLSDGEDRVVIVAGELRRVTPDGAARVVHLGSEDRSVEG